MRPILTPAAASIVSEWVAATGRTAPDLVSDAIVACSRSGLAPGIPSGRRHGLGPEIRRVRRALKLTQAQVARAAGVSEPLVSLIERGIGSAGPALIDWLDAAQARLSLEAP